MPDDEDHLPKFYKHYLLGFELVTVVCQKAF